MSVQAMFDMCGYESDSDLGLLVDDSQIDTLTNLEQLQTLVEVQTVFQNKSVGTWGAGWTVAHPSITLCGQPMYSAHPQNFPNIYPVDRTAFQSYPH